MKYVIMASCLIILMAASCRKNKPSKPLTELEKLPPITQTGANTFGCLLNGKAWIPGGGGVFDNVFSVQYDPTFQGGRFSIKTKKIEENYTTYLTINADSIHNSGTYPLYKKSKFWIFYSDIKSNECSFETINDEPIKGYLTISKFDTSMRIVSGTFSFSVSTSKCGLIEASEGRFDVKY
ncbi:MAG: hypothetical protein JSS98_12905 [Bacteroidetes bacterium]|nr:hypothetical protein [Bacteroidota bacterium]